ncbi:hypothetical protein Shyd_76280 [Streptomyces hydrogenans]|uniref:Uncharacterized protein n=1 Tax=Streptomyces hydrogenans TaxID=1873719 RepID=A0ABQ3PMM9_9ACTN|nr:hypothetical protein GCM10018784_14140 [Streptomyces hydrogenans]GHI26257.1 hypothetical protein Shyd_76280 [Streptomyces hydrogenans]
MAASPPGSASDVQDGTQHESSRFDGDRARRHEGPDGSEPVRHASKQSSADSPECMARGGERVAGDQVNQVGGAVRAGAEDGPRDNSGVAAGDILHRHRAIVTPWVGQPVGCGRHRPESCALALRDAQGSRSA